MRHEAKNLDTSLISTCVLHALNYVDADGTYRPQLLARPPKAEDGGLTYAYRLRADRSWHDGRPVSAQDVAFTHRLMMDPGSGIPERDGYDLVEGIEIESGTEFRLRLARPYPGFRDLFTSSTGSIMPRHLLEGIDFTSDWDTALRPASGPFRLSEWRRGECVRLRRNPGYPHAGSGIDGIDFVFDHDTDSQVDDVIAGKADAAFPPPTPAIIDRLRASQVNWSFGPGEKWEQLSFQHRHPLLADRALRSAIAWGIDRDALASTLPSPSAEGRSARLDSLVRRPHHPDYRPSFSRYRRDVARARQILRDAGYRHLAGALTAPDGTPVRLRLMVPDTDAALSLRAELIASWLSETGVEVVPTPVVMTEFLRSLRAGDFELAQFSYSGNPDPIGHNTLWTHDPELPDQGRPQGQNYVNYRSPRVAELLGRSMTETDPVARAAHFADADRLMAEDLPSLPLLVHPSFAVWNPLLSGPEPYPYQAGALWNVHQWVLRRHDDAAPEPVRPSGRRR
ncbi:ABC transporter substrate-binding protein [Nocardiopsis sp. NRRL B-16309]|uniref:ABC transporter substrate-binding protein n=1 Tax=Nocardiopsis sp. NRRL B-16309 TaxID=1519494 RepID=UPI001E2B5FA8|nr:peptide ABC transporter substrate-binding protein [Nocardiopsis sp. NRRL B-16309]